MWLLVKIWNLRIISRQKASFSLQKVALKYYLLDKEFFQNKLKKTISVSGWSSGRFFVDLEHVLEDLEQSIKIGLR